MRIGYRPILAEAKITIERQVAELRETQGERSWMRNHSANEKLNGSSGTRNIQRASYWVCETVETLGSTDFHE